MADLFCPLLNYYERSSSLAQTSLICSGISVLGESFLDSRRKQSTLTPSQGIPCPRPFLMIQFLSNLQCEQNRLHPIFIPKFLLCEMDKIGYGLIKEQLGYVPLRLLLFSFETCLCVIFYRQSRAFCHSSGNSENKPFLLGRDNRTLTLRVSAISSFNFTYINLPN